MCLSLLSASQACSSTILQPEASGEADEWPRYWTADDVRRLRPELLDFSQPSCLIDFRKKRKFLTLRIRERADEVMEAVRDAMELHGFVPLPEYPGISSENKYLLPDDIYSCYYLWYGFGTDDMMLVQHYRILPPELRAFGPPRVWYRDSFRRMLQSILNEGGLSDSVEVDDVAFQDGLGWEEYVQSLGPEHLIRYREADGTVVKRTSASDKLLFWKASRGPE